MAGAAITLLVLRQRRLRQWEARAESTYRSVQWLNDTYVPSVLALGTSQQLQQSWREGSMRFSQLDGELTALRADAPDQRRDMAAEGVRAALASLGQSLAHVVELAGMGAPGDVQIRAAAAAQQERQAVDASLLRLAPRRRSQ